MGNPGCQPQHGMAPMTGLVGEASRRLWPMARARVNPFNRGIAGALASVAGRHRDACQRQRLDQGLYFIL
jgi:hypothetical protein